MIREPYVHEATLTMDAGGDIEAPGAAVTLALCGAWEHDSPCPVAPHHNDATPDGGTVRLRTVFVAEPLGVEAVRATIEAALRGGEVVAPDGPRERWSLVAAAASKPTADERALGLRLAG